VLKSYDQATGFLQRLHRLLIALGVLAVLVGSALVVLISHRFTRPLKSLVAGVRSLEAGNFAYPLDHTNDDEIGEVTAAFDRMRQNLRAAQQKLLDTERAATIGHMAGSISHDLRHSLTAVMANAEFLCEGGLDQRQREELYDEIRVAVRQMTEMIESLLEFSRTRELLRRSYTSVEDIAHNAVSVLRTNPQWQKIPIHIGCNGPGLGWFDPKKLERVFYNLLLNACEAVPPENGSVEVDIRTDTQALKVSVRDNGKGIPETIRHRLFQPFVSFGKENGTGMGLAVVQKIVQDHGGEIGVESTPGEGTVFRITLPLAGSVADGATAQVPGELARNLRTG
jgi:signal transduction histidine kinase